MPGSCPNPAVGVSHYTKYMGLHTKVAQGKLYWGKDPPGIHRDRFSFEGGGGCTSSPYHTTWDVNCIQQQETDEEIGFLFSQLIMALSTSSINPSNLGCLSSLPSATWGNPKRLEFPTAPTSTRRPYPTPAPNTPEKMKLYYLKVCAKLGNPYLAALLAAGFYVFLCMFNFGLLIGTTAGCAFLPSPRLFLQVRIKTEWRHLKWRFTRI